MGILDLKPRTGGATKIDGIFCDPEVSEEYKDHLLVALIHPMFPHAAIHRELLQDGYSIGLTSIKEYRAKLSLLVRSTLEDPDE